MALLTSRPILLQSKGERMRAWVRARLPACCLERDSWSAYIFPPQSRSARGSLACTPTSPSRGKFSCSSVPGMLEVSPDVGEDESGAWGWEGPGWGGAVPLTAVPPPAPPDSAFASVPEQVPPPVSPNHHPQDVRPCGPRHHLPQLHHHRHGAPQDRPPQCCESLGLTQRLLSVCVAPSPPGLAG